jgi:hypothetical protein
MSQLSTQDIMILSEKELVAKLKPMNTEELEHHAQGLMLELGEEDYAKIMKQVMAELNNSEKQVQSRFELVQNVLRNELPNKAIMSDIYQRLASIVMLILAKKYQSILKTKSS